MANEKINVPIVTSYDDKAAKKALTDAEKIDKLKPEIEITADAKDALKDIDKVSDEAKALDRQDAEIVLKARGDAARAELREVKRALADLDGDTATVKVDADTSKMSELTDLAGQLPGPLGEAAGLLSGGGGIAAGAGLAGAAILGAANNAANLAIEAQTIANQTGASVENASRLLAVANQAGIEYNDLSDILGQMNGVLADSPEIAKRLGVNLNDGKDGAARMVELIEKVNSSTLSANEKALILSKLFGEEGVRQVGKLTTLVGTDLQKALDDVSDTQVITEEDVRRAREFKEMWAKTISFVQGVALSVGQRLIPILNDAAEIVEGINTGIEAVPGNLEDNIASLATTSLPGLFKWFVNEWDEALTGADEKTNTWVHRQAAAIGEVVAAEVEHARAVAGQAESRKAANTQMETYVELLEQRGEEAADEKAVTEATDAHYTALARVNTEAERVDRARILQREWDKADALKRKYDDLHDAINDEQSLLSLKRGFENVEDAAVEAYTKASQGAEDAEQAADDARSAVLGQKEAVLDYIESLGNVPEQTTTAILALIDQGKYAAAQTALERLSEDVTVDVFFKAHIDELDIQRQIRRATGRNQYAAGTGYSPAGMAVVGENGPELVNLPAGAQVIPAPVSHAMMLNGQAGGGSMVVNINMPRGSRGVDVVRQVSHQARRSGRRYGVPVVHYARQPDRPGKGGGRK